MIFWFNEATYFDPPQSAGGQPYYNNPQNYTIQMNSTAGVPTTGWNTTATVNGWFLNSNIHLSLDYFSKDITCWKNSLQSSKKLKFHIKIQNVRLKILIK
jgi:hypothetical protein